MALKDIGIGKKKFNMAEKPWKTPWYLTCLEAIILSYYMVIAKLKIKKDPSIKDIKGPFLMLQNHGSFIDFIYAAGLLRKYKPHFIVARLYFYHNFLRSLLQKVGAFPKSMFALDMENAKNCLTVLKNREILTMMPEARLSTAGRFEDIQDNTYSFIKKSGVAVYTVKIDGGYLADPKWGKGFRRGALVEVELDILYTAQQVKDLSPEQLRQAMDRGVLACVVGSAITRPMVITRRYVKALERTEEE